MVLHGEGLSPWSGQPDAPLALERLGDGPVLLQLFLRGNPFRAGRDAQEPWAAAIQQLSTLNRLAGVVVYGSPYLWESLQAVLPRGSALPPIPPARCRRHSARCSPRCSPTVHASGRAAVHSPTDHSHTHCRPTASNLSPTSSQRPCSASR